MKFFESVFNAFLTRDQRERVNQSNWDKSVAHAARELRLQHEKLAALPPTPPSTPQLSALASCPMTPSLSSSSSHTAASSSGLNSPSRSRPSTSYSTSPRPEFRRHLSIQREPISYDDLMSSSAAKSCKPRRASQDAAPACSQEHHHHHHHHHHQMLYPLPPLGPMEGIGKYRRSVDVTDEYLDALQRNTIAALQPLVPHDDRVSRFRRRDTTTPPRTCSTSPPLNQRLAMQAHLAGELDAELELALAHVQAQPLIEDCPPPAATVQPAAAVADLPLPQQPSPEMAARANSRPVRVATRRRAHNSRERNSNKTAKRAGAGQQQQQQQHQQQVGGISRGVKTGKNSGSTGYKSRQRREVELSASMETLVSGEE